MEMVLLGMAKLCSTGSGVSSGSGGGVTGSGDSKIVKVVGVAAAAVVKGHKGQWRDDGGSTGSLIGDKLVVVVVVVVVEW